jgi:hypothetical protein
MKMLLFYIVFITISIPSFSNCEYSKMIKEAELNIVRNNFSAAIKIFNQIDSKKHSMFAIDIHNAIVCAIILNDEESIKKFGSQLSEIGLPQNYFFNNKAFKKIAKEKYWVELAKKSEIIFLKKQNQLKSLKFLVDSLIKIDSYYNDIKVEKSINRDTVWLKENSLKYENIIKDNAFELLKTFEKYGFPKNNDVIFYMPNDTTLLFKPTFSSLIIHSYQGKRHGPMATDTFFTPILRDELNKNSIKPETYAFLQDNGNLDLDFRDFYGTVHMFVKEDNALYASPYLYSDTSNRNKIEELRDKIGLPTLSEEIERIKFYFFSNNDCGFIFHNTVNTYKNYSVKDENELIFKQ